MDGDIVFEMHFRIINQPAYLCPLYCIAGDHFKCIYLTLSGMSKH